MSHSQNHCIIRMEHKTPVIQLEGLEMRPVHHGFPRKTQLPPRCTSKITVHTAFKIKWIHYVYIYTYPFFHHHGSVENHPKLQGNNLLLENLRRHFPRKKPMDYGRVTVTNQHEETQISFINTLEFDCGKAAGCHSLHHPSWPQANPRPNDEWLVGESLVRDWAGPFRQISQMIPFIMEKGYWRKSKITIYIHLPPCKHKNGCIYIYIYIYIMHTSFHMHINISSGFTTIYTSIYIYTHMLIFLGWGNVPRYWLNRMTHKTNPNWMLSKSELFHYDPNQPQKLHQY